MTLTCPDCHQTYRPSAGHCRGGQYNGCCRSFANNPGDNDPHRTGDPAIGRRCKTDAELLDEGWEQDGHMWRTPKKVRALAQRAAGLYQSAPEATEPLNPHPGTTPPTSEPPEAAGTP